MGSHIDQDERKCYTELLDFFPSYRVVLRQLELAGQGVRWSVLSTGPWNQGNCCLSFELKSKHFRCAGARCRHRRPHKGRGPAQTRRQRRSS